MPESEKIVMLFRALIVAAGIFVLSCQAAFCQPVPAPAGGTPPPPNLLGAMIGVDVARTANDFRLGGEALDRMAASLARVSVRMAEAMVDVSENLAVASSGFDPFGFKTAFQTIQRQNEIVREQSATIQELQQQEVKRLRKELKRAKRKP
jgi:hypothetical protein